MTRKQIEQKAKEIANKYAALGFKSGFAREFARERYEAATEMADWALSHQWVSVEDELPPQMGRYSEYVIIRNRIGGRHMGCYDYLTEKWLDVNFEDLNMDATHWMPIPPIAEKGGEK